MLVYLSRFVINWSLAQRVYPLLRPKTARIDSSALSHPEQTDKREQTDGHGGPAFDF